EPGGVAVVGVGALVIPGPELPRPDGGEALVDGVVLEVGRGVVDEDDIGGVVGHLLPRHLCQLLSSLESGPTSSSPSSRSISAIPEVFEVYFISALKFASRTVSPSFFAVTSRIRSRASSKALALSAISPVSVSLPRARAMAAYWANIASGLWPSLTGTKSTSSATWLVTFSSHQVHPSPFSLP